MKEHVDIKEAAVGKTRGERSLDKIFTNFNRKISNCGTLPPLQSHEGILSDHRVAFVRASLEKRPRAEWLTYWTRKYSEQGEEAFGKWLASQNWDDVLLADTANTKAGAYQRMVGEAMDRFFPMTRTRRRSDEHPWVNDTLRKKREANKRLFKKEGRSDRWKTMDKEANELERQRRESYVNKQRENLTGPEANKRFHVAVKNYKSAERPSQFDVKDLFPGLSSNEAAEELADFFNKISREFDALEPSDIPTSHQRDIPVLEPYQVAGRLRAFKKPKSMVKTDVYPALVTKYADLFAIPLTNIYNTISEKMVWPAIWKREYVTPIPKKTIPETMDDLRNISCTALVSKVYESYVLEWLKEEVTLKPNQFGGVKGSSVEHLLCSLWHEITENLEDNRAATLITAVDYAKAFNRLSYQHCLSALKKKGASSPLLGLVGTFLMNRTMEIRVDTDWVSPRSLIIQHNDR
jgi:hypothetical protein